MVGQTSRGKIDVQPGETGSSNGLPELQPLDGEDDTSHVCLGKENFER